MGGSKYFGFLFFQALSLSLLAVNIKKIIISTLIIEDELSGKKARADKKRHQKSDVNFLRSKNRCLMTGN